MDDPWAIVGFRPGERVLDVGFATSKNSGRTPIGAVRRVGSPGSMSMRHGSRTRAKRFAETAHTGLPSPGEARLTCRTTMRRSTSSSARASSTRSVVLTLRPRRWRASAGRAARSGSWTSRASRVCDSRRTGGVRGSADGGPGTSGRASPGGGSSAPPARRTSAWSGTSFFRRRGGSVPSRSNRSCCARFADPPFRRLLCGGRCACG